MDEGSCSKLACIRYDRGSLETWLWLLKNRECSGRYCKIDVVFARYSRLMKMPIMRKRVVKLGSRAAASTVCHCALDIHLADTSKV